jgi:hypothetical protein
VRSRDVIVAAILVTSAALAWHWIWLMWGKLVTDWGVYRQPFEWLDQAKLLLWVLLFVLGALLGVLVSVTTRPSKPLLVGLISGIFLGLVLLVRAENYFSPDSSLSTYVWVYGLYLMAPLGALTGVSVTAAIRRQAAV